MEIANRKSRWGFKGNQEATDALALTFRGVNTMLNGNLNPEDPRPVISLGSGDPARYPIFRTSADAEAAVAHTLGTGTNNHYPSGGGAPASRKAVADYLNRDLSHKLTADDVHLVVGCNQGIEIILDVLARPNANILLPRPSFPQYNARALLSKIEVREFDLLPEQEWEIDLEGVKALADENTVAIVIVNPSNPSGKLYTEEQLKKVAETAYSLGIMVISDEVYSQITYVDRPFVPMGKFASTVPVVTLSSLSKGWFTPGWRLGWIALHDPYGIFDITGVVQSVKDNVAMTPDPPTFIQVALPGILENTPDHFFEGKRALLKQNLEFALAKIQDIHCFTVKKEPEACTYILAKLNFHLLVGIKTDLDFCMKLAYEESLITLPGSAMGLSGWIRISFGVDPSALEEGYARIKSFYQRHAVPK